MPFYLEYTVRGVSVVRSALPGQTLGEAVEASEVLLRESGSRTAVLRWSAEPGTAEGAGEVAAIRTDTAGWNAVPSGAPATRIGRPETARREIPASGNNP